MLNSIKNMLFAKKERQQKALTIKGKDRDILELRKRYETANNLKEKDCLSVYFEKVEGLNKEERLFYTFYWFSVSKIIFEISLLASFMGFFW